MVADKINMVRVLVASPATFRLIALVFLTDLLITQKLSEGASTAPITSLSALLDVGTIFLLLVFLGIFGVLLLYQILVEWPKLYERHELESVV